MNLKQSPNKRTGRTYLSIVKGYRDENGKSKAKTIKSLGYLDELEKEYDDPIAHFKQVAKEMTEDEERKNPPVTLSINLSETLEKETSLRKNFGYAAILQIFHELELDKFFLNKQRHKKFAYNTNSIMQLLVTSRLLTPCSKKRAFENKDHFFERFDFTLNDVYRSLTHFAKLEQSAQKHIHEQITSKYGRNTELVYYDVTNYYFEIDQPDDFRKKGVSKEHRKSPIVQMGLFMDSDGLPLSYKLFPGNTSDVITLRDTLSDVKKQYNVGRSIIVADRGIISGDNIYYLKNDKDKDGYVFSYSVLGADAKFKEYVLSEEGYENISDSDNSYRIKSRLYPREITVSKSSGGKMKKPVDEKQVIIYSEKYAKKAKQDRMAAVKKALNLVASPASYNKATSFGAAKYVKNLEFDKETGEIITSGHLPCFDFEKLAEEEKYDGYYAIVTSEMDRSDEWVLKTYRGLWQIEESFRITKSDLETRPIHVSREDRIHAHFLSCFIALVIARLLQRKTGDRYSVSKIMECIRNISCSHEQENLYLFDYRSELSDVLGAAIGVDFSKKRMLLSDIKKSLASVKKC